MKKDERGFSLIELLIVVAVVLILAAMTIPALLRSRIAANEASAAASVRSINTAQLAYLATYDQYADGLNKLGIPASGTPVSADAAGFIDEHLSAGDKQGYNFSITGTASAFAVSAWPKSVGYSGIRSFCSNEQLAISYATTGNPGDCKPGMNSI